MIKIKYPVPFDMKGNMQGVICIIFMISNEGLI